MVDRGYFLQEKSEAFAGRMVKMYQYLTLQKSEYVMSKQVFRSGTSIGANIMESKNAQSPADFIHKLSIALKEADETTFWIKNLYKGGYLNDNEILYVMMPTNLLNYLLHPSRPLKTDARHRIIMSINTSHLSPLTSHL